MKTDMSLFEDYKIRRVYDEEAEMWWFSVIDIVQVLTQQEDYKAARNYWKVLKNRLIKEGRQLVTDCNQLKMATSIVGQDLRNKCCELVTNYLRLQSSTTANNDLHDKHKGEQR